MRFVNDPEILTIAQILETGTDASQCCTCRTGNYCVGDTLVCKTLGQ